ncbi:hypothetical protein E2562_039533 [Oryza meyeriana var. granulata]|uniref:Uncharacterized protein n=1 Tax=Oryza meyeriana var. granulata TaxID=110450 RepID=A0A6G1C3J6_9ORYZ|nr:hypothetical protein E2562_039533 [Oryza meyeriana var. granulata]
MDRRVHVSLLAVVVVVVVAAAAVALAGADATSSTGAAAAGEVVVHRRVLSSSIQNSALNANRPACLSSCPASGGSYTGRGCKSAYQCNG